MNRTIYKIQLLTIFTVITVLVIVYSCVAKNDTIKHTLINDNLRVDIFNDLSMVVTNKHNNKEYNISGSKEFNLLKTSSENDATLFHCFYLPDSIDITVSITLKDSTINFQLIADSLASISDRIYFPGSIIVKTKENFIVPYATGIIMPASDSLFLDEFDFWKHGATMSFVGVSNMNDSYMITSEDPWDTGIAFDKSSDSVHYTIQAFHEPSKRCFGYTRNFHYTFISQGDYVQMCKHYRSFAEEKGYIKTLKNKAISNPNVNKLIGAVDFWLMDRQFRTPEFINQLSNFGVDKAIFSLSGGWYTPKDFSTLIDTINALGYLSSRYDLLTDVWPSKHPEMKEYRTSGFPENVVVDANDSLYKGWVAYPKPQTPFQGYIICSHTHPEYIDQRLSKELVNSHYNARFIDVELSLHLLECYSPQHPTTRHKDALNRIKTLKIVKNKHALVTGAEEAYDWAFPQLDFSEGTMSVRPAETSNYNWSRPIDNPDDLFVRYNLNPALKIPLHSLVYHDVHVPTWYTGDGVSKVPAYWDDKDLFNILYGTMPLFLPPNYSYWEDNREKFLTTYHLVASVFKEVGFAKMSNHQMLSENKQVQKSTFDNGWETIVNFSNTDYSLHDLIIPSKGFYTYNGQSEVARLIHGENEIAFASLPNKLFINPYGKTQSLKGIRSDGAVVLTKHRDSFHLALIGDENFIDIKPENLPWPVTLIDAYTDKKETVKLIPLESGWLRLKKQGNNPFYRINYSEIEQ